MTSAAGPRTKDSECDYIRSAQLHHRFFEGLQGVLFLRGKMGEQIHTYSVTNSQISAYRKAALLAADRCAILRSVGADNATSNNTTAEVQNGTGACQS